MGDKGFFIVDLCILNGIYFIIFFLKKYGWLIKCEVEKIRRIVNLRIYVEWVMEWIKIFRNI